MKDPNGCRRIGKYIVSQADKSMNAGLGDFKHGCYVICSAPFPFPNCLRNEA